MKKLLLFGCALFTTFAFSQTTLFQDNFEAGSSQWTLNTGSGGNNWVVNNAYIGFSGFIPDTPNQPVTFTNGPQSSYMHITNTSICSGLSVCNANFDTGSASNQNSEIATAIDVSGQTNVTVSFWYLCAGQTGTSFGTMEYSLDGGTTWIGTGTNYQNVSSWTQESVTMPAWDNAGAFKIRFKWQNGGGGLDPAFSIDEVIITGTAGATNSITTANTIQPTSWCFGNVTTVQVNFTSTGTYTAGNVYTAQLSDASGSFASPTTIGTLNSTASGTQMIVGVIPGNIPVGSGYRIRVVSSNPATIGTDNGTNLEVLALPVVQQAAFTDLCVNDQAITLSGGTPTGGTYSGTGVSGGFFNPNTSGAGTFNITYSYATAQGCSGSAIEPITVNALPTPIIAAIPNQCDTSTVYALLGTPPGGTFAGPGVTGSNFNASAAGLGTWTLSYDYTDGNGCSAQAIETVTVTTCSAGINEGSAISLMIYPNPTDEFITISADVELSSIVVLDVNGRSVKLVPSQGLVDVSDLNSGVYFIQIEYNGQLFIERIAVK